jgi:beta-alanine--pyruvate transaminase
VKELAKDRSAGNAAITALVLGEFLSALSVQTANLFGSLLAGVDRLPHTHSLQHNAFSRKQPEWGAPLADELQRIVALHDASNIAAVIVEPVAGSTGVLIPPKGYLERLRAICYKYGILQIFDEVITGFGRVCSSFATEYFGVVPDIVTAAKGITNGTVPMGAVFVKEGIYDAFMNAPKNAIELFHGYTYSGHRVACAAGLATLDIYEEERLFEQADKLADYWENAVHSLKGVRHVIDVRNLGLVAGIELESIAAKSGKRAFDCFIQCYEKWLLIRTAGDIIALSPPLIIEKEHIDRIVEILTGVWQEIK